MVKVIGIDLGTTNSVVAVMEGGKPEVITNAEGERTTPSVVAYTKKGDLLVGQIAKRQAVINPENTFYSVKRFIGRKTNEVTEELRQVSYKILQTEDIIKLDCPALSKQFAAEEISAQVLRKLADDASKYLGESVKQAVITVPAYFDDAQRQATKDAATLSGLKVLRLLNEPTAAAIAYGLQSKKISKIMVYDLGGGTFDVSILDLNDGVYKVLSTGGNSTLGGDDFDKKIARYIEKKLNLNLNEEKKHELYLLAKEIKIMLTNDASVKVKLDKIGIKNKSISITQNEFNELIKDLIQKTLVISKQVLNDAKMTIDNIDEIILVGGSTRTPYIKSMIESYFKKKPLSDINPDNVVAMGASIQADILSGNSTDELLLLDVIPLSLGIETMGDLVEIIIPRNSTIPNSSSKEYTTFKDGQSAMSIHIVQGERDLASDCRSLANFTVTDIPPMLAGSARVNLEFQIDADGILYVSARETSTNKVSEVQVKPSYGISDSEIEKMLRDSFSNAKEDIEMRNLKESVVEAERVILSINSALKIDGKDLLNENEYNEICNARDNLIDNLKSNKRENIINLVKDLESISETYISRRMNSSIQKIMKGKDVKEYK